MAYTLCNNMKRLIPLLLIAFGIPLFANEDHLLMIPTPIIDDETIHIVKRPMISGYGADFEGRCGRIGAPYMADIRSPSKEESQVNLNPVSLAKIQLSAVLPATSDFYTVTIDYSNAVKDSVDDIDLLRAILTCVFMFGDSIHGELKLKANIELVGVAKESPLHAEISRYNETRKKIIEAEQ